MSCEQLLTSLAALEQFLVEKVMGFGFWLIVLGMNEEERWKKLGIVWGVSEGWVDLGFW